MTTRDHDSPLDDGPLDDDTLAVSAVVDDEATPEQRRRVARDPELVARVGALREAVAAVAAPVEPPPADVLAALRARALDAVDEAEAEAEAEEASTPPPAPVRDLGAARARKARRLPPLPAVAAVVVLLVVVGVGLLVAGTSGKDEDIATTSADAGGSAAEESGGDSGGEGGGGDDAESATAGESELDEEFSTRPADEVRDELLDQATASYASEEDLERELRRVDPEGLGLAGAPATSTEDGDGEPATTTTTPAPTTTPESSGAGATDAQARQARAFAADPIATRCDDVLRSAEPELEPAVAAVLVDVAGVPVLVLTNPVEVSDQAPSGLRLTVLNAVDCSPRAAVLR